MVSLAQNINFSPNKSLWKSSKLQPANKADINE